MEIEIDREQFRVKATGVPKVGTPGIIHGPSVALLTGGSDKPYVFGLATELISKGAAMNSTVLNSMAFLDLTFLI
jgi:hypothetical protein